MKSRINIPVAEDEFNSILISEKEFFDNEIKEISKIIRDLNPFNKVFFNFKNVSNSYHFLYLPLGESIENALMEKIIILVENTVNKNTEKIKLDIVDAKFHDELHKIKLSLGTESTINFDINKTKEKAKNDLRKLIYQGYKKIFFGKNMLSYESINYLTINGSEDFKELFENYEDFKQLKNRFSLLWTFWGDYYPEILIKNQRTAILTNEWFSRNYIQETILEIFPEEGTQLINQIDDLLNKKTE